ncbi:MAG: NERD domain-containing protein [Gammaproteobacteria bacterium]|nr:NERD domain-containing protein [Gammaproteobacteria bacterium]
MARLFPKIRPEDIGNPGERSVARALLEQLPRRVEVFHGFNWLARNARGTLLEGECDFILLEPEKGLLFVEVKGGSLVFDGEKWVRQVGSERRELNKDPFAQAQRGMHDIVDIVSRRHGGNSNGLPFAYGFAVAFPDCRVSGWLPPNIHPELILDAAKLKTVPDAVKRIFASFSRKEHRPLYADEVASVREALYPKYELVPVLWRRIEDQEERLSRLTQEQQRILDILEQQPKAAISGVAGSGKTLLALAKAQAMARQGLRTLLLCFNRPLKDWLLQSVPDAFGGKLVIDNYHGLADDLCRAAGVPLWERGDTKDPNFWTEIVPVALEEACERLGPEHKFDAIIVDEGQDFEDLWWDSLDSVFRDAANKACYYVFYDPKQNLFVDSPSLPDELGQPYSLPTNCRNTVRIAAHCASLVGHDNKVRDEAPTGEDPVMVSAQTIGEAFRAAGKQVRELCESGKGGLKPSQAAVLAPAYTERDWPGKFGTIALTKDFDEWRRGEGVLIATWGRFKGLEADAVVIVETPMRNEARETTTRYVARSRAKHWLTVIEVDAG